ncbi:MAG: hypothetical protein HC767_11835, partial [Akkermansiaceae bacterium]|nr:hypothetical protein [Akkermansiaceae bacterium]
PRSPHGVDVAPNGAYMTVSGKLDPHVTVYGFDKVLAAIEAEDFEGKDAYGVPILKFASVMAGQVEVGAGPLHTQYDDKGYGYTSLFLESAVAKWSLGEPYHSGDAAFKLVDKVSIHYNIGHIAAAHGDTVKPHGKWVVGMNKWAIDRFQEVGPLLPQNFQLVDISVQAIAEAISTAVAGEFCLASADVLAQSIVCDACVNRKCAGAGP